MVTDALQEEQSNACFFRCKSECVHLELCTPTPCEHTILPRIWASGCIIPPLGSFPPLLDNSMVSRQVFYKFVGMQPWMSSGISWTQAGVSGWGTPFVSISAVMARSFSMTSILVSLVSSVKATLLLYLSHTSSQRSLSSQPGILLSIE